VNWEPTPNVRRLRLADTWRLLDKNHDNNITLDELINAAPKLGLTKTQATNMFANIDKDESGAIDRKEFDERFKGAMVAVELTTPVERLWAYFVEPRRPAGFYTPIDPKKTNMQDPWVSLFTSFTPHHVHFLVLRISVMVVEAFVLAGMRGSSQSLFLTIFTFIVMGFILWSPPAILLAQSRADTIDVMGKFLMYGIYSTTFPNWLTAASAAQTMTVVNGVILVHSMFTQLEPILRFALISLTGICFVGSTPTSSGNDGEKEKAELTSLCGLLSTEEAVALLWQRLSAQTVSAGSVPEPFYRALKDMASRNEKGSNVAASKDGTFDTVLFDEGLLSLGLRGMNSAVAVVLLQQVSTNGNLMSVVELYDLLNQSKYSTDGRLSRFERASRALSIDEDCSAAAVSSKQQGGLSRSSSNAKIRNPTLGRGLSRSSSTAKNRNPTLGRISRDSRDLKSSQAPRNKNSSPLLTRPIRLGSSDVKTKETDSSSTSDSLTSDSSSKKEAGMSRQPSKENTREHGPLARQLPGSSLNSDAESVLPDLNVEMV